MSDSRMGALFIFGVLALIILFFMQLAFPWIFVGADTPQQVFTLEPNETFSMKYQVHNEKLLVGRPSENHWAIKTYGYIIASSGVPGTYEMTVTTSKPEDTVYLEWAETFTENMTVGDKFGKQEVPTSRSRWYGNTNYYCVSDRNADCVMTMTEGNFTRPELQIYIYGKGSGNITIRRVA